MNCLPRERSHPGIERPKTDETSITKAGQVLGLGIEKQQTQRGRKSEMRRHFRDKKDKSQRATYLAKENYAGTDRLSITTRRTRPPSLPRPTRPSGVQTSLRLPRLPILPRHRRQGESMVPADQRMPRRSTDQKVLWGIWAAFLVGVVYNLWISVHVIRCCG